MSSQDFKRKEDLTLQWDSGSFFSRIIHIQDEEAYQEELCRQQGLTTQQALAEGGYDVLREKLLAAGAIDFDTWDLGEAAFEVSAGFGDPVLQVGTVLRYGNEPGDLEITLNETQTAAIYDVGPSHGRWRVRIPDPLGRVTTVHQGPWYSQPNFKPQQLDPNL